MRSGDQEVRICVRKRICCRCGDGACNRPPADKCSSPALSNARFTLSRGASLVLRHSGVISIGGCSTHALSDFYSLLELVAGSRVSRNAFPRLRYGCNDLIGSVCVRLHRLGSSEYRYFCCAYNGNDDCC